MKRETLNNSADDPVIKGDSLKDVSDIDMTVIRARTRKPVNFKKILIIILAAIVVLYVGILCFFKLPVKAYLDASERTFSIPDTNHGFIAQGLSYDPMSGDFYITGYMNDHSASPIYIVDKQHRDLEHKVLLSNPDGTPFDGHCGGITLYNNKVYVCGNDEESKVYVFDPAQIRSASKDGSVSYDNVIELKAAGDDIRPAFLTVASNLLFIGEFYRDPNYVPNSLHTVECPSGEQKALMVGFSNENGNLVPMIAYSLPDQIQGACFSGATLYLSSSWAVSFSKIYEYDLNSLVTTGTINVLGKDVPLYILDSKASTRLYKISPMSEEIDMVDGKLYTMCESASDKYIFGKLLGANKVYATDMEALKYN